MVIIGSQPAESCMNTTALVIGGAGYIGAHLVPQLLATGRRVTVLGRKIHPLHKVSPGVVYVAGDFAERDLICRLLDTHQEVIHLAYATVPNTSFENPLADLLQNLPPTEEMFSEVAARGGKLLLVSSGGTVYGHALKLPVGEDHPTKPISPYGVTKLTLENYAYLYAATHGLKYICVRPGNAYGVGQRPFVGQGFVSTAIASAIHGQPVKVFGKTGTVRDYIYVSDLASGIVSALDRGRLSETYNIGSGVGRSNKDVIHALMPLMQEIDANVNVEHLPERAFDVKTNVLDSTKLFDHTGWRPVVQFEDGLRRTRNWLRQLLNEKETGRG
jgi:UDP-glucose 4-epimerase